MVKIPETSVVRGWILVHHEYWSHEKGKKINNFTYRLVYLFLDDRLVYRQETTNLSTRERRERERFNCPSSVDTVRDTHYGSMEQWCSKRRNKTPLREGVTRCERGEKVKKETRKNLSSCLFNSDGNPRLFAISFTLGSRLFLFCYT
jgi:hypothetical protein